MKKTMKTMLAFMAGALCLTGCESEFSEQENLIEVNNARFVTLTAYHEGEGATRAAIDGSISTQINWSLNDKINYFGAATGQSMTLKEEDADKPSGTFEGTVSTGAQDFVLYPYQESATCSDGVITANVPMTQHAYEGSFDPAAALMVGTVNGASVEFKNVMSYVKVTIPSTMTNCKQVSLKAKDAWTTVAGTVKIASKANTWAGAEIGAWAETAAKEGEAFVRLVPKAGETKLTAGASYYIAILPQTMATGFELIFNDNDVIKVKQSATASVEFGRSKTKKLAAFSELTYTVEAKSLTSSLTVADRNIGAATPNDHGDYFAWAAKRPAYITKHVENKKLTNRYKSFSSDNAPYNNGSGYTKYDSFIDEKRYLDKEDDIAALLWGGKWRMPKYAELETLMSLTTGESGNDGYSFAGKNTYSGNSVFLPYAGHCYLAFPYSWGDSGYYWSSQTMGDGGPIAFSLFFTSGYKDTTIEQRCYGYSVRAVLDE